MNDDVFMKKLFSYVISVKKSDPTASAVDIITNYCFVNDLEVEYVGALISESEWFKTFVSNDCSYFDNDNKIEEW